MCVILEKTPTDEITLDILQRLWKRNQHGWGIMYVDDSGQPARKRGLTFESLVRGTKRLEGRAGYLHTRFATHGHMTKENCHPYEIMPGFMLMHNGVISKVSCTLKPSLSDSWHFGQIIIRPLLELAADPHEFIRSRVFRTLIEEYIGGGNKVVVFDAFGGVVFNERAWCKSLGGMRASNGISWDNPAETKTRTYNVTGGIGHHGQWDDDEDYSLSWEERKKKREEKANTHLPVRQLATTPIRDKNRPRAIASMLKNLIYDTNTDHIKWLCAIMADDNILLADNMSAHDIIETIITGLSHCGNFMWKTWAKDVMMASHDYDLTVWFDKGTGTSDSPFFDEEETEDDEGTSASLIAGEGVVADAINVAIAEYRAEEYEIGLVNADSELADELELTSNGVATWQDLIKSGNWEERGRKLLGWVDNLEFRECEKLIYAHPMDGFFAVRLLVRDGGVPLDIRTVDVSKLERMVPEELYDWCNNNPELMVTVISFQRDVDKLLGQCGLIDPTKRRYSLQRGVLVPQ